MNVGILIKGGYRIDGMVNSEFDLLGNYMKNSIKEKILSKYKSNSRVYDLKSSVYYFVNR